MNQKPEALIFDFDGVLADTEPIYWKAWAALLALRGIEFTWDEYCRIGRGVQDDRMLRAIPQLAESPALLEEVWQQRPACKATVKNLLQQEVLISKATIELLHQLNGYRLGLVTSSRRANVMPVLEAAGIVDCFAELVFGEDTIEHKPHPAPYQLIQARLAISSGVVFEDTDAGTESATRAGFEVFRVSGPHALPEIVRKRLSRADLLQG